MRAADNDDESSKEDEAVVEQERDRLRTFIAGLSADQIKSGRWFERLISQALETYTKKVTPEYFAEKYAGVPPDAVVEQRIKLAARYAALEGGASAAAYTGAVAATIGTLSSASPITVPAAVGTMMVDVAFTTQLQLRLAYDIAVIYGVPLDTSDPEDLWKLIRVSFTIKGGEVVQAGVLKAVPAVVRPVIKRFYARSVLQAAKTLPVVGKFLLQRNVVKIGIPGVGIPLAVVVNRWSTVIAGRHAQAVFRSEARIIETAESIVVPSEHPRSMLWVAWAVIVADQKLGEDEILLMRHLTRLTVQLHAIRDDKLARVVDLRLDELLERLAADEADVSALVAIAIRVAEIDGPRNAAETAVIDAIAASR